jgi:hypothetical protein
MGQSLELPRGYKVLNGSPVEVKSYNISNTPYTSVSQVLTQLIPGIRYIGLTVYVLNETYVFKDGILDNDLVLSDKVDKVINKSLIDDSLIIKLENISGTNTGDQDLSDKVDKVINKSLILDTEITRLGSMTAIFTTALKTAYDTASLWVSTNGANVLSHIASKVNPHSVTKAQVGLSNVDNTSDADKSISIATQNALDLKEDNLIPTIDNQIVVKNSNGDKRFETFMTADFEFTLDTGNVLRSNISTYPQIITKSVGGTQVFTLDFEPTEILLVHGNVVLMPTDYLFTAPYRFEVFPLMGDGEKIRILFNHFNIQP